MPPAPVPNVQTTEVNSSQYSWKGSTGEPVPANSITFVQPLNMVASGGTYPNTSPTLSGQAMDGTGTSYNTAVASNGPATTTVVPVKVTVTAPTNQTLPTPLTITVNLGYSPGDPK